MLDNVLFFALIGNVIGFFPLLAKHSIFSKLFFKNILCFSNFNKSVAYITSVPNGEKPGYHFNHKLSPSLEKCIIKLGISLTPFELKQVE